MPEISRRNLIRGAAVVGGAAAAASVSVSAAAESADAATLAGAGKSSTPLHGDIRDIKHVVILMQENRSFDHYFGSLKGVRGFGDKATILLPGGLPVWQQPSTAPGLPVTSTQFPWPGSTIASPRPAQSHTRSVPSLLPLTTRVPSGLNATLFTARPCPRRTVD